MINSSREKTQIEEGIVFLGEAIREEDGRQWFTEVELEPLEGSSLVENFRVKIGDDVLVENDESDHDWVLRITELFADGNQRTRCARFKGWWLYRIEDIELLVTEANGTTQLVINEEDRKDGLEKRRVWLAEQDDNDEYITENPIGSIIRPVDVKQLSPGDPVPQESECDFWYNQTHSRKFNTFKDLYKPSGTGAGFSRPLQRLNVLDLFCGCGGLSFIDQKGQGIEIKTTHCVDIDGDALKTYQTNRPDVAAYQIGIEEFLFLCKHFDRLASRVEALENTSQLSPKRTKLDFGESIAEIKSIELKHSVHRVMSGQSEGQLAKELIMENTWLSFKCRRQNGSIVTIKEADILQNKRALRSFTLSCNLPRPGDIQVIVGGPPCQGVSGLNRHAQQTDVLSCHRNRLVKSFFKTIEFFQPEFTLMENVQDILKKEGGAYAKYATAQLLALGYQSRLGVISAGGHGAAQIRWRCFLWGALSGKVMLPPFPQPEFRPTTETGVANIAKSCQVTFIAEADREKAYPPVLNEDILTDLPEVSNFRISENTLYKSAPVRPIQMWLRRAPAENAIDLVKRAERADEQMKESRELVQKLINSKIEEAEETSEVILVKSTPIRIAEIVACQKTGGTRKNDFASEIREILIRKLRNDPNGKEELENMVRRKTEMLKAHGLEVMNESVEVLVVDYSDPDLLRDHRPRICNSDDYYRITQVPKGGGKNFRNMPGVIETEKGTCCAGHTHAFKGHGCPGGGTVSLPEKSIHKESRVDHADREGWRGLELANCPSRTYFTPTLSLVCPRWCITYKNGRSQGRHSCFGRVRLGSIQPTVVTRAEPHNLEICHPHQDRVLTIREMARCQGFPDYYVFVGTERHGGTKRSMTRLRAVENRYRQIGNAVAPPVAAALGRCLLLAASGRHDISNAVVRAVDKDMVDRFSEAGEQGLKFYAEELGIQESSGTPESENQETDESGQLSDSVGCRLLSSPLGQLMMTKTESSRISPN